jgi:hypothetical protein
MCHRARTNAPIVIPATKLAPPLLVRRPGAQEAMNLKQELRARESGGLPPGRVLEAKHARGG